MTNINWRAEALEFARVHDTRNHMVIQLVEKAMRHGAFLIAEKITDRIKESRIDLEKRHKESMPHKRQTKMIDVDLS